MSSQSALVIDLTEYRRRREAKVRPPAQAAGVPPVVWVPVWMWVPFWPMR